MVDRLLVTTADERTWPEERDTPVLFLGEWCRRFSRQEKWGGYDASVAEHHWADREKLYSDYRFLMGLYETVLASLTNKLNEVHGTRHSVRYWRILIGPWLGYFSQVLFDRWYMLRKVVDEGAVSRCHVIERPEYSLVPSGMQEFNRIFVEDDWNEALYAQLLSACWSDQLELIGIRQPFSTDVREGGVKKSEGDVKRGALKQAVRSMLSLYNRLSKRNRGIFFLASYLPLKTDLKLQRQFSPLPQIWESGFAPQLPVNEAMRQWSLDLPEEDSRSYLSVLKRLIPLHIPTLYLEGYEALKAAVATRGWPEEPKLVFTSNAYSADDIFKCWCAEKVESGSSLVIGQHGGLFNMTRFSFSEDFQHSVADIWLSWADSCAPGKKGRSVGMFHDSAYRRVTADEKGGAVLVQMKIPRYTFHLNAVPQGTQWLGYFNDQKRFINALPEQLRADVTVRLFIKDYGWDQIERWKAEYPDINIDRGTRSMESAISENRLFIGTYNATTYLEAFSWNVPTLLFWNPTHWELNERAVEHFDRLKSVGIYHDTPESAARQMEKIWGDVKGWWLSEDVQAAVASFRQEYAKVLDRPVEKLRDIFNDTIETVGK